MADSRHSGNIERFFGVGNLVDVQHDLTVPAADLVALGWWWVCWSCRVVLAGALLWWCWHVQRKLVPRILRVAEPKPTKKETKTS